MSEIEQLEKELADLLERRREIGRHVHKAKNKIFNNTCRRNRALIKERGFSLKDVIEGRARIENLDDAIWFNESFVQMEMLRFSCHSPQKGPTWTLVVSEIIAILNQYEYDSLFSNYFTDGWYSIPEYQLKTIRGIKK